MKKQDVKLAIQAFFQEKEHQQLVNVDALAMYVYNKTPNTREYNQFVEVLAEVLTEIQSTTGMWLNLIGSFEDTLYISIFTLATKQDYNNTVTFTIDEIEDFLHMRVDEEVFYTKVIQPENHPLMILQNIIRSVGSRSRYSIDFYRQNYTDLNALRIAFDMLVAKNKYTIEFEDNDQKVTIIYKDHGLNGFITMDSAFSKLFKLITGQEYHKSTVTLPDKTQPVVSTKETTIDQSILKIGSLFGDYSHFEYHFTDDDRLIIGHWDDSLVVDKSKIRGFVKELMHLCDAFDIQEDSK